MVEQIMHAFDSAGPDLVRAFVDMQTAEWEDEIKYLQRFGVEWLEHATVLDSEEEVDDLGDDLLDDIGDALPNELPCGGGAGAGAGGGAGRYPLPTTHPNYPPQSPTPMVLPNPRPPIAAPQLLPL